MGFLSLFMMTALLLGAVMDGSVMVNAYHAISARIVGGEPVQDCSEFPFLVRLESERISGTQHCGGAIISDRHILTAAHCVEGHLPTFVTAHLGDYDKTVLERTEKVKNMRHISIHPNYDSSLNSPDSDIAVLTLSSPIGFLPKRCIKKINMASSFNYDRQNCWVVGWGELHGHDSVSPNTPMKVQLPVYKADTCKKLFHLVKQHINMNDRMLCTGTGDRVTAKGFCSGDSGGPIACQDARSRWKLVGIVSGFMSAVSNGKACAERDWPGFNVNVAAFNDWIKQQMRRS